jgi:hypothetical protein
MRHGRACYAEAGGALGRAASGRAGTMAASDACRGAGDGTGWTVRVTRGAVDRRGVGSSPDSLGFARWGSVIARAGRPGSCALPSAPVDRSKSDACPERSMEPSGRGDAARPWSMNTDSNSSGSATSSAFVRRQCRSINAVHEVPARRALVNALLPEATANGFSAWLDPCRRSHIEAGAEVRKACPRARGHGIVRSMNAG